MQTKNRGWVKNAAIIFLTVLLLLTFFSNTILNYSLPEVSGQYPNSGDIATAVRGTGTVTANESFNIEMEETRQIKRVLVKVGDIVEAGQVIMELEDADSDELKTELTKLDTMLYEYNKTLLGLTAADYNSTNLDIKRQQEDLQAAIEKRDKISYYESVLDQAKLAVRAAQDVVDALKEQAEDIQEQAKEIQEQIDNIDLEIDEDLLTGEMKTLRDKRDALKEELDSRKKDLEKAKKALTDAEADTTTGDTSALQQKVIAQIKVVNDAQSAVDSATNTFISAMDAAYGAGGILQEYDDYVAATDPAEKATAFNKLLSRSLHSDTAILTALTNRSNAADVLMTENATLGTYENQLYNAQSGSKNLTPYKDAVKAAEKKVDEAQDAYDAAVKEFDNATKDIKVDGKEQQQVLKNQLTAKNNDLKAKNNEIKAAERALEDAKSAQTDAEADAKLTVEEADAQIKTLQRALEDKLLELSKAQTENNKDSQLKNLELEQTRKAIADQEEVIAKLREKNIGTEITSRYGGTVLTLGGIAGDKINQGETLASIEVDGKGYSLSFSVSIEESRRIKIGETSVISSYWGEDTVCTLVAIKTHKDDPSRRKLLELEVKGDVQAGQSLTVSLGERTAYYEYVVPNSAVREDQNGNFVLVAEQKSTPLGNRYIAQRIDVEVLAKDSTNSAVSGAFEWGMYVITTATKPVEPGTQVRLVGA